MLRKYKTFVSDFLETLKEMGKLLPLPFETPYQHMKRMRTMQPKKYYDSLYYLEKQGIIKTFSRKNVKYVQLTKKGEIETLLIKARINRQKKWDKHWRMIIFDIPETHRHLRDKLRQLLRRNSFHKLQASVFINPYPLNREAIVYLKESGLIEYIRILKISEIDDDRELKRKFKLV